MVTELMRMLLLSMLLLLVMEFSAAEHRRQQRRHDETPNDSGECWRRPVFYVSMSRHDGCGRGEVWTAMAIDRHRLILRVHAAQPKAIKRLHLHLYDIASRRDAPTVVRFSNICPK